MAAYETSVLAPSVKLLQQLYGKFCIAYLRALQIWVECGHFSSDFSVDPFMLLVISLELDNLYRTK
jgi:hypothetical protein